MKMEQVHENGINIAVISGDEKVLVDVQSALDLAMTAKYEVGATCLAIDKRVIAEDFFILSTGMAGEVLQKFINYHIKAAIWGEYSHYTSKPLKDFLYESNHGKDFFFVATREEAVRRLAEVS